MMTRGCGKSFSFTAKMIVEFVSAFDLAGALAMAFHFNFFAFVAFAFELQIVDLFALLLSIPSNLWIAASSLACKDFVASFRVWIRPPRKPPNKSGHPILQRVHSPIDC